MGTLIRSLAWVLLSVPATVSVSAGGTINGAIEGWPAQMHNSRQPTVVWLEGTASFVPSKIRPVMAQRGGQFVPPFLVVVAGQTVEMPNEDDVAHNVYSVSSAKGFNLGYYAKGARKSVTFDRPGMVDTLCVLHSFMRGKILVVPNPYYALVGPDGSFRIRNAPPGTFTLRLWADGLPSFGQAITVPAGATPLALKISLPPASSGK